MQKPLLQSAKWQKFQNDIGKNTIQEKTETYEFLATIEKTPLGNYLYLPYGPVVDDPKNFKKCLNRLTELCRAKNAFFVRIEPQNIDLEKSLRKKAQKTKDLNPKDTWVLDLQDSKEQIITNFSQGTRTRFNQFAQKGLTVTTSKNPEDIQYLISLQQKLAKEKNLGTFSDDYLKTELSQDFATLYLVHYTDPEDQQDHIIAASLFFDFGNTRYYTQSAADSQYKKLPGTVALLCTSLFDAKEKGLKYFDFWGIAPDNAPQNHPWYGFTEFKKSFGGFAVSYCGTYDLIIKKPKYTLYKIIRKANRLLRKI